MNFPSETGSGVRVKTSSLLFVLAALALALLWPAGEALASKALVYNATGEDLKLVVNGRSNLLPWKSPVHVFSETGQKALRLEMPNTDGELLTAELEPGRSYVILYRVSKGIFAIWGMDQLETNLDQILEEHPATAKAAVFNSTGRPIKFKFGPWERGIGREMCVFIPNAASAKELKFKIIHPDLGSHGPLAQSSLHVVTFDEDKGYSFLSFDNWVAGLRTRLDGSLPEQRKEPAPDPTLNASPEVLQEDLKDS